MYRADIRKQYPSFNVFVNTVVFVLGMLVCLFVLLGIMAGLGMLSFLMTGG